MCIFQTITCKKIVRHPYPHTEIVLQKSIMTHTYIILTEERNL
jgi:hypothetical protein